MTKTSVSIAILLMSLTAAAGQGVRTASIQGRVLRGGTAEAIAGVRVTYYREGRDERAQRATVTTDATGMFAISNLEPGDYRLSFSARGYTDQDFGQKIRYSEAKPIELAPGQILKDLVIRMAPGGSIQGRVRDGEGAPAIGVPVELVTFVYNFNGDRTLSREAVTLTDDRGEYRLFWLAPDRYYLRAGGMRTDARRGIASGYAGVVIDGNQVAQPFAETFYPSAASPESASLLEVGAGAELKDIDFRVKSQQLYRIRGSVVDSRTGLAPAAAEISLSAENWGMGPWADHYNRATGTFELRNLWPGNYTVLALFLDADANPLRPAPNSRQPRAAGFAKVRITDSNLDDVVLQLLPPVSLSGRLVLEDGGALLPDLRIELKNPEGSVSQFFLPDWLNAPVSADGSFLIPQIISGTYNVAVSDAAYYVKQAQYAGADVASSPLKFSGDRSSALQVVISPNVAQLSGTITDALLQPSSGTQVALVPDQRRDNRELFYAATTDARGRYTLTNIRPGDYKLYAWEAIAYGQWFDPNVVKKYETNAQPVRLLESDRKTLDAVQIPAGIQ